MSAERPPGKELVDGRCVLEAWPSRTFCRIARLPSFDLDILLQECPPASPCLAIVAQSSSPLPI